MRKIALLMCALAFALLAAGCGDDDSDTATSGGAAGGATSGETGSADDTSGETGSADGGSAAADSDSEDASGTAELSKEEFTSRATAICKEASERFQSEFKALAEKGQQQGQNPQEALADGVLKAFKTELDEIGDLPAPSGDEAQVQAILDALREATEEVEANPTSLQQAGRQVNEARQLASRYGIKGCPLS